MSNFVVRHNALTNHLNILFNEQDQILNKYTDFAGFLRKPFEEWAPLFPEACIKVSGTQSFSVTYEGEPLYADLLRLHLKGQNLRHTSKKDNLITINHRLAWANELSTRSNIPFQLPPLRFWPANQIAYRQVAVSLSSSDFVQFVPATDLKTAHVVFLQENDDFSSFASDAQGTTGIKLFLQPNDTEWELLQALGNCYLANCPPAEMDERLKNWYTTFVLPNTLQWFQRQISGVSFANSADEKLLLEKKRMLTDDRPYLSLNLPLRIEVGDNTTRLDVIKLPEDMRASATVEGGCMSFQEPYLIPQKEGCCRITVTSVQHPEYSVQHSIDVYKRHPVTSIRLTMQQNTLQEGEQFLINAGYVPANADNIALARWSVSDPQCVKLITSSSTSGTFRAMVEGTYTITLHVGNAVQNLTIRVLPTAKNIKFSQHQLKIKVTNHSQCISTSVLPANAKAGDITYNVSDSTVLSFDKNNGQITPISPGLAVITAYLVDSSGNKIAQDSCSVEILPKHAIITPDGLAVVAVVSLLFEFFLLGSAASIFFSIATIVLAIVSMVRNKMPHNIIANGIIIFLAIVVCFV